MKNHEKPERISQRAFLKEVSLAAGGASLFSMAFLAGCNSSAETTSSASPVTGVPEDLLYSIEHVWVMEEANGIAKMGITEKLWNMVTNMGKASIGRVEAVSADSQLNKNEVFATIETSKMTIDLFSPVSGEVIENNNGLLSSRNLYGNAWIIRVKMDDPEELEKLYSYEDYLAYNNQSE